MAKQTRQQAYDECKAKGLPLPDIVKPGPGIASQDVNTTDVREIDPVTGEVGPWQRADAEG